jgi:hypothetical protein
MLPDAEEAREGQFQSPQERRCNDVSGFGAQLDGAGESMVCAPMDPHDIEFRRPLC